MIFPWHEREWAQLWQAKLNQRLPHALLFLGARGLGKMQFADRFSQALLCENINADLQRFQGYREDNTAPAIDPHNPVLHGLLDNLGNPVNQHHKKCCGTCHACRLTTNRTHPNLLWIEPEKTGQAIKVDQIRMLAEFTQQSSFQGDYRIVIIHPAHAMNINAANALLKTLEEPSPGVLLILISDQSQPLLPTLLSRCQRILFAQPEKEIALSWLKQELKKTEKDILFDADLLLRLAKGAPLSALEFAENNFFLKRRHLMQALYLLNQHQEDPLQLAASFEDIDIISLIDMISTWILDVIWLAQQVNPDQIVNQDFLKELDIVKARTNMQTNIESIDYLCELRGQLCAGINLNKRLVIESIFIRWMNKGVENYKR